MIDVPTLRVLLIEDNPLDERMMRRYLADYEPTRFEVSSFGDLVSALAALDTETVDCILLDLSLPDSQGLASVDAILERSPKSPIVVLTGLEDPSVALRAVERGAQDYLTKQLVDSQLVGRSICYAVARHHSETQLQFAHQRLDLMEERERIARDLHDTVIQQLFATGMGLQALAARVEESELRTHLDGVVDGIDNGIRQLREAIFGLHVVPERRRVTEWILEVAESQRALLGFVPTVRIGGPVDDLDSALSHHLVSVLREGLTNVGKHADATAVEIDIELDASDLVLRVLDNGVGLGAPSGLSPSGHLTGRGVANMRRRAAELSGRFRLGLGPGGGTELVWRAPLDSAVESGAGSEIER